MDVYSPLSFSIHWRIYPEQLDIKKRDTQNRKEVKKKKISIHRRHDILYSKS